MERVAATMVSRSFPRFSLGHGLRGTYLAAHGWGLWLLTLSSASAGCDRRRGGNTLGEASEVLPHRQSPPRGPEAGGTAIITAAFTCWPASSGWVRIPLGVHVYRIVQCHSKLHVRQWRAKDSRPLVHPCRQKLSVRSTLWRLSRCHQTKLSSVPVRVGALTDGISDTPSVSPGN
jgi:hypothetical protein